LLGELGRQAESVMRQVLASGTAVVEMPFSGEMPTQPGRTAHYLASFYPVADSGHTTGVGGVVVDVTERHEAAQGERFALEAAQVARARAEALARASTALTSSMRTERVLDALVRAVVPALADFCAVHLVRPDETLEAVAVAHGNPACEDLARRLADRQALDPYAPVGPAAVIRTGVREVNEVISPEALVHEGVHPDERALLADLEVRSAVILPLSARGAIVGALTLAMGDSGRRYEPDLVELVESLGAGVGLALDNARLFAEQAEVARALQRTLLPSELPYIPGALLAARYRAAGRSNQAGGDFYDVFAADEGEWALMIGDVVGKGAAAAAITSLVRATLQAAIIRGDGPRRGSAPGRRGAAAAPVGPVLLGAPRAPAPGRGGRDRRPHPGGGPSSAAHRAPGGSARGRRDLRDAARRHAPSPRSARPGCTWSPATRCCSTRTAQPSYEGGDDRWRGEAALRETLMASAGLPLPQLVERVEHEVLVLSGGELRDDLALLAVGAAASDED
jgi:GAF domain-containing protein